MVEEKFKIILDKIIDSNGPVVLFSVLKMDELTDKWTIILVANWINEENRSGAFNMIINIIKQCLSEEDLNSIARVGIFPKEEHLIDLLLNFKEGSRIQDQKVNGNLIHDGYIIASRRNQEDLKNVNETLFR